MLNCVCFDVERESVARAGFDVTNVNFLTRGMLETGFASIAAFASAVDEMERRFWMHRKRW